MIVRTVKGTAFAAVLAVAVLLIASCAGRSGSAESAPSPAGAGTMQTQPSAPGAPAPAPADFRSALAELGRRQQVEVTWTGGPWRYDRGSHGGSAEEPAEEEVARLASAIIREFGAYPDGLLRRLDLEGIVLVRDLFVREDGGGRGAAAYIFDKRVLLDLPSAERAIQARTRVRFIHHLLWHRLDELAGTLWNDPEWEALNPADFRYGVHSRGGVHETRAGSGLLTTAFPGFTNLYSTGNLPDDKAEVFAYLMTIHSWMAERSRQDRYLGAKVAMIKKRLAALDPAFNDAFWARVNADSDDAARYGPRR